MKLCTTGEKDELCLFEINSKSTASTMAQFIIHSAQKIAVDDEHHVVSISDNPTTSEF